MMTTSSSESPKFEKLVLRLRIGHKGQTMKYQRISPGENRLRDYILARCTLEMLSASSHPASAIRTGARFYWVYNSVFWIF